MAGIKKVEEQYGKRLELIFKIAFLCLAISTFNSFLYVSALQSVLVKGVLLLGMCTVLVRMLNWKKYVRVPGAVLMILFCISFVFSVFMNRQYELIENLKWVIWTGLLFFLLYVCDVERERAEYRKEFRILSHILILYTTVAAVIGLGMLVTSYNAILTTADGGEAVQAGFSWGRLWGVYTDPNYGSVISVVTIILATLFCMQRKGCIRIFYIASILLNGLYVVFSDSRTGKITLSCCVAFYVFLWLIWKNREKSAGKRFGVAMAAAVCIGVLLAVGCYVVKKEYNQVLAPVMKEIFLTEQKKPKTPVSQSQKQKVQKETVGRKSDIEKDVSNGRLALWESAVEIWKTSPVYGTGYTSLVPYCKKNIPDTYAVNNSITNYASMHNAFLNTLVYQGIIGFVLLLAIAGRIIVYGVPQIFRAGEKEYMDLIAMLSCISAVVIGMMFLTEGTYTNSPGSFVLWTFSGYLVQNAYKKQAAHKN
mgnify:CR=1 FL=1